MRIARVEDHDRTTWWAEQHADGRLTALEGSPYAGTLRATEREVRVRTWLPVVDPRAILCIGRNYRAHAEESGVAAPTEPVLFLKNPAAATGHDEPIRIPSVCGDEVDYEGEFAVVIGSQCRNVSREDAVSRILGYTIANDVSARIWQFDRGGSQWCRGKGFDTFAPLGPVMVTPDALPDTSDLAIRTQVNGETLQESSTAHMMFDVPTLVAFLSQDTTLLPGTVILTGTPEGIGWARTPRRTLRPGDTVAVTVEGVGTLVNPVTAA